MIGISISSTTLIINKQHYSAITKWQHECPRFVTHSNEFENSANPKRALRHAYKDLVTTFELYCKRVSKIHQLGNANFQDLLNTKRFFKRLDIDIYKGVEHSDRTSIKRIFEKRHAYEHGTGEITDRYVKNVPEDSKLLGLIAELSKEEFISGISIIKEVIKNIREKYSS